MVEMIKVNKDRVLDFMKRELDKYGPDRMDVKEIGELADVVKDLAEAEYYCTVAHAMEGGDSAGYTRPMEGTMGYSMGYQAPQGGSQRSGYGSGSMGHTDPIAMIRDVLMTSSPEKKAQIRNEIMSM